MQKYSENGKLCNLQLAVVITVSSCCLVATYSKSTALFRIISMFTVTVPDFN